MDALALGLIIGFSIFGCFLLCCSPMLCLTYKVRTDPEGTYKWITKKGREKANWDVKTISVGGYTYSYLESLEPKNNKYLPLSQRQLIVMIHGFSSNKDAWNQMAAHLAHRYHLIAIDLVGHGETHPLEADDYKMATQAERLHSVIQAIIGEKKMFHITGTSMGGHVAGVYAAIFPQQVISLCLLCCAGVQGEHKAKLVRVYEETGRNYLLPTNLNEFMDMMREVFFKPPPIPKSIANYLWQLRQSRADTYHKIMQDMIVEGHLLQTLLPTIKVPVQVQWGDMDYILDISAIDVIKKHLPSPPDVVIFKNCGHGLQLEFHKQSMLEYQRWLKTLSPRSIQIETVKELPNEKTSLMSAAIPTTVPGALDSRIDVTV